MRDYCWLVKLFRLPSFFLKGVDVHQLVGQVFLYFSQPVAGVSGAES